ESGAGVGASTLPDAASPPSRPVPRAAARWLPRAGARIPGAMPLVAGIRLGPYEILSTLGAGGMGEVYVARDARLNRDVAIKVLPSHLAKDPAPLARFEREARAVAATSHPNILAIFDV